MSQGALVSVLVLLSLLDLLALQLYKLFSFSSSCRDTSARSGHISTSHLPDLPDAS